MAGIDGNGQSELVYGITGLIPIEHGQVILNGKDITKESIRQKCLDGVAHIPEDRHKDGLVLDYTLQENLVLQSYYTRRFQNHGFLKFDAIRQYAKMLIEKFDIRSSQGRRVLPEACREEISRKRLLPESWTVIRKLSLQYSRYEVWT